jgi:ankyrin repeat protein
LAGLTPLHLLACCSVEVAYLSQSLETLELSENTRAAVVSRVASASDDELRAAYKEQLLAVVDVIVCISGSSSSSSGGGSDSESKRVAAVNARTYVHGETPLTFAAYAGACEVAQLLLAQKADPNLPRLADGSRPLDLAAKFAGPNLACALLEHGAEVR